MVPELNPAQKDAAEAPLDRPLLIVAGAGTGKTKTLTSRLAFLIERDVPPTQICALTFTNKAAREMVERVSRATNLDLPSRGGGSDIFGAPGPFVGTFHSLGARILRKEAALLGRSRSFAIFDDQDTLQLIRKIVKTMADDALRDTPGAFAARIGRIKNGQGNETDPVTRRVFERYEAALMENNAFDFDDLIDKVARLLTEHPERLAWYRKRFSHFLIDEYQDLNNRQYDLVRTLVGSSGRISVVGDDQQTIYSWRGSNFEIFMNFERDWPNAKTVLLEQNYRSSANIIEAATGLIAHNRRQKPKTLWTEHPVGEPIRLTETLDETHEALLLARDLGARRAEAGTTAVLYRTNAQSRPIEQALIEARIPYRIYGGLKFYERREIKDALAALRYAANPKDAVSRDRLEKNFTKTIFRAFDAALAAEPSRSPLIILNLFLETTNYFSYIAKHLTNILDREENVAELIRFAGEFTDLTALLEEVTLLQATDEANAAGTASAVTLMTMHLAKGLEFDRVHIVGIAEGLLPHSRSLGSDAELEEERRLLYVGMTRARSALALSFFGIPSRFLSEIPAELLVYDSLEGELRSFDDEERYITID